MGIGFVQLFARPTVLFQQFARLAVRVQLFARSSVRSFRCSLVQAFARPGACQFDTLTFALESCTYLTQASPRRYETILAPRLRPVVNGLPIFKNFSGMPIQSN